MMTIRFYTENIRVAGKLADFDVQFVEGPLAGMKIAGFSLWTSRDGRGLNVTPPSREYTDGEGKRKRYPFFRPVQASSPAEEQFRARVFQAWERHQARGQQPRRQEASARPQAPRQAARPSAADVQLPPRFAPRQAAAGGRGRR